LPEPPQPADADHRSAPCAPSSLVDATRRRWPRARRGRLAPLTAHALSRGRSPCAATVRRLRNARPTPAKLAITAPVRPALAPPGTPQRPTRPQSGRPDSNRGPHRPESRAPRSSRQAKSLQIGRFAVPRAAPDYARFVQISLSLGTGSAECLNRRLGIDCPSMAADLDVFCIAREQARTQGLPCFWRSPGTEAPPGGDPAR
jgi:hypothetical protein